MPRPVIDASTSGSIDKYLCSCRKLSSGTTNQQINITWSFPIQKKNSKKKSCSVYTTNKPRKPLQTVYSQFVRLRIQGEKRKEPFRIFVRLYPSPFVRTRGQNRIWALALGRSFRPFIDCFFALASPPPPPPPPLGPFEGSADGRTNKQRRACLEEEEEEGEGDPWERCSKRRMHAEE